MRQGHEHSEAENSLTLLPNPVTSSARLIVRSSAEGSSTVRVTDANGSLVFMKKVQLRKGVNHVNLDVASLAAGQYTVSSSLHNARPIQMIRQ